MRSGANLPAVGTYNQAVILDAIRRAPKGISRVEVAERTGLSAQTATNVCRRLLAEGLIHETGLVSSGVGKPRRILELRPNGRFAVGIHLDPSVVTVVLLNLAGAVVEHQSIPISASATVDEVLDLVAGSVAGIVAESGVDESLILGAGVAAPGPIDLASGTVIDPPLLSNWGRVPVREALAARLAMPVLLEKDVTAAAVAETWSGEPEGSFVFFYYGTGVGVGFALHNEVVRGASGNSGEVGSIVVGGGGPTGPIAGRWRLGEAIMPRNIVDRAIRSGTIEAEASDIDDAGVKAAFGRIAALATEGNVGAREVVDSIASDISEALLAIIDLLDVDRVVFGGPFWHPMSSLLLDRIPRLIRDSNSFVLPHPVVFDEAAVGEDVAATGAACLVLDNALAPRRASMLIQR